MATQTVRLQANTTGTQVGGQSSGRSPRPAFSMMATGTFGGGSLKPQVGFMQTTGSLVWMDVTGVTPLAAAGTISFDHRFDNVRLVLSGASSPDIQVAVFM